MFKMGIMIYCTCALVIKKKRDSIYICMCTCICRGAIFRACTSCKSYTFALLQPTRKGKEKKRLCHVFSSGTMTTSRRWKKEQEPICKVHVMSCHVTSRTTAARLFFTWIPPIPSSASLSNRRPTAVPSSSIVPWHNLTCAW